jgi:AcrR family transcriptional regulator
VAATVSTAESRRPRSDHGDLSDRILDAAERLVFRTGARKLSLSDVATLAGVSRPTIYRYFVSKEDLIDAMGKRERRRFSAAMDEAMSGVVGVARLEAAADVVASFLEAQPPGRLLDLEPGFAHDQMSAALPMITDGLVEVLQRCAREGALAEAVDPRDLAGAIARTALSHYIFPETDRAAARQQIRAAAGLGRRA